MIGYAVFKNDRNVCYIAPTFQAARDIAWDYLKKRLAPIATNINESRLEIIIPTKEGGTSRIVLRGWEAVENLRGQKFDFIVIDEVAMVRHFWVGWNDILSPTLVDTRGHALFISTPKGFNHFFELYNQEQKDQNFKSFHFTTYDNPNIPKDEIDRERATKPEDSFAQEYLADFRKMEGLVYKDFSRNRHIFDGNTQRRETVSRLVGVDWGWNNPSAVILIEKDSDGHYWVSNEWYKREQTTEQIIEWTRGLKSNAVYPDPAEPDRIQLMKNAGLNVRDVSKDVVAGIDTVRELLKQGRLHIHKDCVNTIAEFETYRYEESRPDKNEPEKPVKDNDHALDALRYVLHMDAQLADVYDEEDVKVYGLTDY